MNFKTKNKFLDVENNVPILNVLVTSFFFHVTNIVLIDRKNNWKLY